MKNKVIVSAQELHDMPTVRIFDVRWQLGKTDDLERFAAGHIADATFVDLEQQLARPGKATDGRHPLPAETAFGQQLNEWGLTPDSTVVIYDDNKNLSAARMWWLLRNAGIRQTYLLDGGIQAWEAAGFPVVSGTENYRATSTQVNWTFGHMAVALPAHSDELVDSRAAERFAGVPNPVDKRPGHIPGAINLPTTENVDESGNFLGPDALKKRFTSLNNPTVYCGSGVTACHNIAAMEIAGIQAKLYPGSYSAWEADPVNDIES
ncbi:MAG: sulfurtransferase [Micrococcaceae bacterium]